MTPSQAKRDHQRKASPKTSFAAFYPVLSYAQAIRRACQRAGIAPWSPNRLRHTFATETRKIASLDAVQVQAGHAQIRTTQLYARRNLDAAVRLMSEIG